LVSYVPARCARSLGLTKSTRAHVGAACGYPVCANRSPSIYRWFPSLRPTQLHARPSFSRSPRTRLPFAGMTGAKQSRWRESKVSRGREIAPALRSPVAMGSASSKPELRPVAYIHRRSGALMKQGGAGCPAREVVCQVRDQQPRTLRRPGILMSKDPSGFVESRSQQ
jgi:hypothetical protein